MKLGIRFDSRKLFGLILDRKTRLSFGDTERIAELCNTIANEKAFLCFTDNNPYLTLTVDQKFNMVLSDLYE